MVSAPVGNGIIQQKDIFRLAAAIYSENSDVVSETETQLQMVKTQFVVSENAFLKKTEIISNILDTYSYHISQDELDALIKKNRGVFISVREDDELAYCLTKSALDECNEAQKHSIDVFIDQYISEFQIANPQKCREAIHVYLYELTTTNINSYRVLLTGKDGTQFTSSELSVDVSELSDSEKLLVHDFLNWNNIEKNTALGNLIYCCLEYCLLIHGDSPNRLLRGVIRNREIYLDTNIIFRALGINGISRQRVMLAFLDKCKQAKLKLIISHITCKEFFDTIDYYVSKIYAFPHGNIYPSAYEQIADYNIFAFYEEWYQNHSGLPLNYFKSYIRSLYADLVKKYSVYDDKKIPDRISNSDGFKDTRNKYATSIMRVKQGIKENYCAEDDGYTQRDSHDATLVSYIETLRGEYQDNQDIFLVSSDKALRLWDMNRIDTTYPVVIYPSQLFLALLKTCGRSQNDYDSFVSFINIHPRSKQITPENAHIILSGISSITEDIKTQEHLVSAVYGNKFQDIIQSSSSDMELFIKVQRITQNYLDEELSASEHSNKQLIETVAKHETAICKLRENLDTRDEELKNSKIELASKATELEEKNRKIAAFAEMQTKQKYRWKVYGIPILLLLLAICYLLFIVFQFCCATEDWNYVIKIFEWVKTTPFGSGTDSVMYTIDGILFIPLAWLYRKLWRNTFNTSKNEQLRIELSQKYTSKNKIG